MARYSFFVLKVPLNIKQPTNCYIHQRNLIMYYQLILCSALDLHDEETDGQTQHKTIPQNHIPC